MQVCQSMEDNVCMFDALMEVFQEATPECHTNCISTEYNSLISSIHTFNDSAPIITVAFASTVATINEEYLIYDFSGMVSESKIPIFFQKPVSVFYGFGILKTGFETGFTFYSQL